MNRLGTVFWVVLAMASGFAMYMVKYGVQSLEDELARVRKQTVAEQLEIRVLNAEWSYLTQPSRLAELNKQFVSLAPIATKQLQQNIDNIPLRALSEPPAPERPAELSVQAAPPPAAAPPESNFPVTPVALNSASTPVPQGPRPMQPARRLDDLFAQIAGQR
jgi:hypothetical protein